MNFAAHREADMREPRGRAAMKRGKFVDVTRILACSLQGMVTGGLHCPDFAQRRRAVFSSAALLHFFKIARGRFQPRNPTGWELVSTSYVIGKILNACTLSALVVPFAQRE
jgi:hypothetical protein